MLHELIGLLKAGFSIPQAKTALGANFLLQLDQYEAECVEKILNECNLQGVSAAAALERLNRVFDSKRQTKSAILVAVAAPKATAKLVTWLPLVSLAFSQLLGLDPIGVIATNRTVDLAVAIGVGLLMAGNFIAGRMINRASTPLPDVAIDIDLAAIRLQAGLPIDLSVLDMLPSLELAQCDLPDSALRRALEFATDEGIELGPILTARADWIRHAQYSKTQERIERLSIRLLIPMALTVLPAFLLLAVVPTAASLLQK